MYCSSSLNAWLTEEIGGYITALNQSGAQKSISECTVLMNLLTFASDSFSRFKRVESVVAPHYGSMCCGSCDAFLIITVLKRYCSHLDLVS